MFRKPREHAQLQLSELDKKSEYKALVDYVNNKNVELSNTIKVIDFQKAILSSWLLQKIKDNKLNVIVITEALKLAHDANMFLEQNKDTIGNRYPKLLDVFALSSYSTKLDAAFAEQLEELKKNEYKSNSAPLEVAKTSLIKKSELGQIIVNLEKLLKSAEISLNSTTKVIAQASC